MQSQSEFLKNALRIIEERPAGFKALEEFEKTGRAITKTRLNFTIDRELAKTFKDYCKKHKINMSELVENFIKDRIKTNK